MDYTFAPTARSDLLDIWGYVAQSNTDVADRLIDSLYERFSVLGRQPLMGESRPDLGSHIRQFCVDTYVIFYVPRASRIRVVRVLHSSRDIPAIFRQECE